MDTPDYGNYDIGSYITSKLCRAMEVRKAPRDKSQYSPRQETNLSSPGMLALITRLVLC